MMELKIGFNLLLLISLFAVATEIIAAETTGESAKTVPQKPNRKQFVAHSTQGIATGGADDVENIISKDHQLTSLAGSAILPSELDEQNLQVGSGTQQQQGKLNKPYQRPLITFELPRVGQEGEESESSSNPAVVPHTAATTGPTKKGSFFSGSKSYFKDTMKNAYKVTRKYVKDASDSIAFLRAKTHLNAEIDFTKGDIKSIRKEYSLFTVTWSPIMESALNYVGSENLNTLKWSSDNDELDFSRDALHTLAFGYEFMRLLNAWRESLLPVLEAYRQYVQTMRQKLLDQQELDEEPSMVMDDRLFLELKIINNYLLLTGWLSYDELSKEPRDKLEYLIQKMDIHGPAAGRDFERPFLRHLYNLAKTFEKTRDKFERERKHVVEALAAAGAQSDSYPDVDEFYDEFRDALDGGRMPGFADWRVPEKLQRFLEELKPELELNPLVYDKQFLWRLDKGL